MYHYSSTSASSKVGFPLTWKLAGSNKMNHYYLLAKDPAVAAQTSVYPIIKLN
jgi:hypothetical protein